MRKRNLHRLLLFCTLALLFSLWMASAMAAQYELYIAGEPVTDENCKDLSKLGNFESIDITEGGEFSYNPKENILKMRGVKLVTETSNAIENGIEGLTIDISGENSMLGGKSAFLGISVNTIIKGDGVLNLQSFLPSAILIGANSTLTIDRVTMNLEARLSAAISGQNGTSGEKLVIRKAKVNAKGKDAAIANLSHLELDHCQILEPVKGRFHRNKHGIVGEDENLVNEVHIAPGDYPLTIAGVRVTDLNRDDLMSAIPGVNVAPDGIFEFGQVGNANLLIMKGVELAYDGGNAIVCDGATPIAITNLGKNKITASKGSVLVANAVFVEGSGELELEGGKDSPCIETDSFGIEGVTLTVNGKWGIVGKDAQSAQFAIQNATAYIHGSEFAIGKCNQFAWVGGELVKPAGGNFDTDKHALVASDGSLAKEVEIKATEYNLTIANVKVTKENCADLSQIAPGVVEVASNGVLKYDHDTKTLTMKDVKITMPAQSLLLSKIDGLTINLSGVNTLQATGGSGLAFLASTSIEGDGTLSVESLRSGVELSRYSTLTLSGITFKTTGEIGIDAEPHLVTAKLVIRNAKVQIKGTRGAIANLAQLEYDGQIVKPEGGKFDEKEHSIVDKDGALATEVEIAPVKVTGVTLDQSTLALSVGGEAKTLTATVSPDNATNKAVTWTSDKPAVATVADGKVTPVGAGTATITVTTVDEGKTATCVVTVTENAGSIAVTGVTLDPTTLALTVGGEAKTLTATVSPDNATNKAVTWTSDKPAVATVADGKVTPVGAGTAIITVTTVDGSKTATCTVTVTENAGSVAVTGVTLAPTTLALTVGGEAKTLTATVSPDNATNKAVTWTSDKPAVATVADGKVTPVGAGTATITVTTVDGGKTATCVVTVKASTTPNDPKPPQAVEDALLSSVTVAPNPFTSQLRIANPEGVAAHYELLSLSGVVIRSGVLDGAEVIVETSELPAGIYFVRFYGVNTAQKSVKVVKY